RRFAAEQLAKKNETTAYLQSSHLANSVVSESPLNDSKLMTQPIFSLALALAATVQCLAQTPEPTEIRRAEVAFEELPELKASEILKPELLKGPHFVVRDPVPTAAGM